MPLVGEQAWHAYAYNTGDDLFSLSWDIDIPPSAAFIKVVQGDYFEFDDKAAVDIGLINMRRRKPDNSDETINFPNIDGFDTVRVQFNPTMTHVTFGMNVKNCYASLVWTLGFWA